MAPIYDTDLASGRMLNETDLDNRSLVAVIGTDVVDYLLPGTDRWARKSAWMDGPIR